MHIPINIYFGLYANLKITVAFSAHYQIEGARMLVEERKGFIKCHLIQGSNICFGICLWIQGQTC